MNLKAEVLFFSGPVYRTQCLACSKSVLSGCLIGFYLKKGGILTGLRLLQRNVSCQLTQDEEGSDNKEDPMKKKYNHKTKEITITLAIKYKLPKSYFSEVSRYTFFKLER